MSSVTAGAQDLDDGKSRPLSTMDRAAAAVPALETRELSDGTTIVSAEVDLPMGWSRARTRVRFLLPVAFPAAQPDCFFADLDLRLADGNMPQNSGIQPLDGENLLWFSWHLTTWSPSADTTATYLRFIERRLRDVR